jgi:nickel-type superoxide dismutase maturation protease
MSLLASLLPFANLVVADESMAPTLLPGDRVLAWRKPFGSRIREGDIVVLRDPTESGRLLVKRIASLAGGMATVLGDNASVSRDSRAFGPVRMSLILGRVAYRYLPSYRRGPM